MLVNIDNITVNQENRKFQGAPKILESIKREGIIVPLIVYEESKGKYFLVDGHNRLHSARHFGLKEVPCIKISKESASTWGEIANIDRQPLTEMDEIISISKLAENGYSVSEIAGLLGISRARAGRKVNILKSLGSEAKKKLHSKKLSLREAELLTLVDKEQQEELIKGGFVSEYAVNALLGIDLKNIGECFKKGCSECKDNTSTDADLFDQTQSICRNAECLKKKISEYVKNNGYKGVTGWVPATSPLHSIKCYVSQDYTSSSADNPRKDYINQKKFITFEGKEIYMGGTKIDVTAESPAERKRAAIIEVIEDLNNTLAIIYSLMRTKASEVVESLADKSECKYSFIETEALYYTAKFLMMQGITSEEKRYIAQIEGGADFSNIQGYEQYFKAKWPKLAKIDDVKNKKEFKEAVSSLIMDNAAIDAMKAIEKKIKNFMGFQIATAPWLLPGYLAGDFMDFIRQYVKLFEAKFGKCVDDGYITKSALLYSEALRVNSLPVSDFEEV